MYENIFRMHPLKNPTAEFFCYDKIVVWSNNHTIKFWGKMKSFSYEPDGTCADQWAVYV